MKTRKHNNEEFDATDLFVAEICIEERGAEEVKYIYGDHRGERVAVRICPEETPAANYGFDVTPARLITALITERGICKAVEEDILAMYPERVLE